MGFQPVSTLHFEPCCTLNWSIYVNPFTGSGEKYLQLQGILREIGRVVIGFSGGVDSTLLLRAALDTLG